MEFGKLIGIIIISVGLSVLFTTGTSTETYVGIVTNFKERFRSHKASFQQINKRNETGISQHTQKQAAHSLVLVGMEKIDNRIYIKNNSCLFYLIPKENGILIESIDVCFGLAWKKESAISSQCLLTEIHKSIRKFQDFKPCFRSVKSFADQSTSFRFQKDSLILPVTYSQPYKQEAGSAGAASTRYQLLLECLLVSSAFRFGRPVIASDKSCSIYKQE